MASKMRQELPPAGGFGSINWQKKIPKRGFGGYATFGIFLGVTVTGWVAYFKYNLNPKRLQVLEETDSRIALQPFMLAEQSRAMLKQIRKNRDEEEELMKDVPGWKTGTWYGEPVYHDTNRRFPNVDEYEYFMHNSWSQMYNRVYEKRWH